ncbi:MAG: FG-GAP repeat domain-containing protein, partial [Planctomycetota bacterium]
MRLARASGTATALLLAIALAAASGCDRGVAPPSGGKDGGADGTPAAGEPPPAAGNLPFEEITEEAGIRFRHFNGFTGKRYIVEIVGSGGGFLDYDLDGDLDLYLVNGSLLPGTPTPAEIPTNRLYRNDGSGRFEDVTGGAGVADRGYGMGLAAGDIDNDGDPDLYVTNYGPNALYRNRGDGTFEEIAAEAGVSDPGFSSAAVFFDHDNDGDLDLYGSGYLIFDPADFTPCRRGRLEVYCSPDAYDPVPGRLYQNDGSGR